MVDTTCTVWTLTLFLYLILIIIFRKTTCFVKRTSLKQLSSDRQRPVVTDNHFQSTMKRATFIIQIGFLEVCAGLVVVMEATAVKFDIVRNQPGKGHCSEYYQCAGQLHYISCAVVGCLFISIVRCLAQRYVLTRLSKSDVVSMTRIYLVPATCFVTVLCVWSWVRLYGDREKRQSDKMVCCHVIQTFPLNSFLLILLPIFWNLVIDYSEYRKGKAGFASMYEAAENSLSYDSTSLKQTNLISEVLLPRDNPSHTLSKTTDSISGNDKEIENTKPALSINTTLPVRNLKISYGSHRVQLTDKTAASPVFDSLRDFLNTYTRIYFSLVIYLAVLIGVYAFLENCHSLSGLEDLTTAVFMTMLVITGSLRAVQVIVAEVENKDGSKCDKICQINV